APFPRFTYDEAMARFGSDKPDLRFGMELVDLAPLWEENASGFRVFDEALASGGLVKAIVAPGRGGASRKEIDELTERAKRFGAKGLVWIAVEDTGALRSQVAKFLGDDGVEQLARHAGAQPGDLVLVVADAAETTADVLGRLRAELGVRLGLADPNVLSFCWIY